MEDIYPITYKDLEVIGKQLLKVEDKDLRLNQSENEISFLLPLLIDLLNNVDKMRELKTKLKKEYPLNKPKTGTGTGISAGILDILKAWLEENNGTGNLVKIINLFNSKGGPNFARGLEKMLLDYSLPSCAADGDVYSLSKDFLKEVKDTSGSDAPLALQNTVIIKEIFNNLVDASVRKAFRLVTPLWENETLSFWRKLAKVHVTVLDKKKNRLSMSHLLNLLELEEQRINQGNDEDPESSKKSYDYKLTKYPFQHYRISYYEAGPGRNAGTPFFCGPIENKFWEVCGPLIKNLRLENAFLDYEDGEKCIDKICERLLLSTCVNLQMLQISNCLEECNESPDLTSDEEGMRQRRRKKPKKVNFVKKQEVAKNLHTLHLNHDLSDDSFRKILFICPNLKTAILDIHVPITCLQDPTANGEYIKLDSLSLTYNYNDEEENPFAPLRGYTVMLTQKNFNCLQHLSLDEINLSQARSPPFHLYAAIGYCSNSLKTIELELSGNDEMDTTREQMWFTELSPFSFPNLTRLKLTLYCITVLRNIPMNDEGDYDQVKFDFGTVKGMPKLEQLYIRMRNGRFYSDRIENIVRNVGTEDWVFAGNQRNRFFPREITTDYIFPEQDPILCPKLKKFTFLGWDLNEEDVQLLSTWFPNVTQVEAQMEQNALPRIIENWHQIEKMNIHTQELVPLRQLRALREKRKHIKISQTLLGNHWNKLSLQMKEHNKRLFFSENEEEPDLDYEDIDWDEESDDEDANVMEGSDSDSDSS